ncbi:DUF29 family protein [Candidatus Magnetomoraceae bacterium gMMP-15]
MEELFELKSYIMEGRYDDALSLIGELEEMSKDDKINNIHSYAVILLMHIIKQHAENRSTKSWERSIYNSVQKIALINKRRKSRGYYLKNKELDEILSSAFKPALKNASFEAFEGKYDEIELASKINKEDIKNEALEIILKVQVSD